MSDNEYERFEITDYDLENEFNPNRPRRKFTKNQQIYGIWADDSDYEGEESDLSSRRKKAKDYSKPLNFVSGGVQQAGKKKDPNDQDKSEITDEEDEQAVAATSSESEQEQASFADTAGMRTYSARLRGVGDWEAHTKGIGSRLLQKMGYEPGKGLGKELQGISAPVQAFVRKGRGAIGAYGPEKAATIADQKQKKRVDEDKKEALEFKEKMSQWKRDPKAAREKKKVRYVYKSVEDVIEKGKKYGSFAGIDKKIGKTTVIDMTRPQVRVLSSYEALSHIGVAAPDEALYEAKPSAQATNFDMPELLHNLNLLVSQSEQEIIANDKQQRSAEERRREMEVEKENLIKVVELERNYINTLESAKELIDRLVNGPEEGLSLDEAEKIFLDLRSNHSAEYKEFGLADLVPGIIAPLINTHLKGWNPLVDPTRHLDLVKKWQGILSANRDASKNIFDPYSALIWAGIIPSFRASAATWNPRVHHPMAALLDAWAPLLPEWILDNILDQLVLAKITTEVAEWNPLTDTVPIHVWIHPWVSLLGAKMQETVYPTIRDKLSKAMKAWSPEDRSARAMITPWHGIFTAEDMEVFLAKNIVPKLEMRLTEIVINPLQQDLEVFNQTWEWHELIAPVAMAQILDKFFFPKWMQTLVIWLNQAPNFDQVSRWYQGWKMLFTDEVLAQPSVREYFRRALELMQRATGMQASTMPESTPPPPMPPAMPRPTMMDMSAPPQIEFKELVSQKCAERGIVFAPMPGRREMGKQVYRVGKLFCYIDRSVCIASLDGGSSWSPISLATLLESAS